MATSEKDWIFANIPAQDGVALIDPVSGSQPIFGATLAVLHFGVQAIILHTFIEIQRTPKLFGQ